MDINCFLKKNPPPPLDIKLSVPRDQKPSAPLQNTGRKQISKPGGGPASSIEGGLETAGFNSEQNAIINSSNTCEY